MLTTICYLFFACNYVILCKRNNQLVNLIDCFLDTAAKLQAGMNPVFKPIEKQKFPSAFKFLSRPRVISNEIAAFNLAVFALILSFIAPISRFTKAPSLRYVSCSYPGMPFYRNWRI